MGEIGDLISNHYENGVICATDPIIVMKTKQNFYVPVTSSYQIVEKAYQLPAPSVKDDLLSRIVEYVNSESNDQGNCPTGV